MKKINNTFTFNITLKDVRHAYGFVRFVNSLPCDILLKQNNKTINGKSIIGILTLDFSQEIVIEITGDIDETTVELIKKI